MHPNHGVVIYLFSQYNTSCNTHGKSTLFITLAHLSIKHLSAASLKFRCRNYLNKKPSCR